MGWTQIFDDIISDERVQEDLRVAYGSVDNIDLWIEGFAEDAGDVGSQVGHSFSQLIKNYSVF